MPPTGFKRGAGSPSNTRHGIPAPRLPPLPPPEGPFANVDDYNTVPSGYAETMGIPVVEGRAFQPTDALGATVSINQTMARTFYKDQRPIGRRVRPSGPPSANIPWFTIVGVLKERSQGGVDKMPSFGVGTMNIVMPTMQASEALAGTIHQAVASLDLSLPVVKLQSMDDVFAEAIGRSRLLAH